MTPCPREGRWIGGCRFEPRYDRIPPVEVKVSGSAEYSIKAFETLTKTVYVRDVCIRCGKTIERSER